METITLRVPENQKADLATEADERDMSLSEYTRKILDHRDPAVIDTDLTSVDDEVAAIYERLDELEAQVSDLRGGRSPPTDEAELLDDTNDEVLDAQNEHRDRQLDTDDEPDTSEWPLLNSLLPGVEITEADGGNTTPSRPHCRNSSRLVPRRKTTSKRSTATTWLGTVPPNLCTTPSYART